MSSVIPNYSMQDKTLDMFDVSNLAKAINTHKLSPNTIIEKIITHRQVSADDSLWISQVPDQALRERAKELCAKKERGPLFGIPFAVKDNIDVAGMATTAACPAFRYIAEHTASVVQKLLDADAVLVGKTNMDQFATGLTGTRTPYGSPANLFDANYICGGSSSGSALAVAKGLVSFSLGTDTAGSGRVPAALNNLIGLKPSLGRVSNSGILPACRSLDCVSIFAHTCADAKRVLDSIKGYDATDPYSQVYADNENTLAHFRFGVPLPGQREFFGDTHSARAFENTIKALEQLGGQAIEVDYAPFREAALLLYEGPWVSERYLVLENFIRQHPDALDPSVKKVITTGEHFSASDAFKAQYRLQAIKQVLRPVWETIDLLLTPTVGTTPTRNDVAAEPILQNNQLGFYTNHLNLLNLCAVAVPCGFLPSALPFGVTLQAPAGKDDYLLGLGDRLHRATSDYLGASRTPLALTPTLTCIDSTERLELVVCGGHMQGLPLNKELVSLGGQFLKKTSTAAAYHLYALNGFNPPRPGLARDQSGKAIDVEVWTLPLAAMGAFLSNIPPPLTIGSIELADGSWKKGFLCEPYALKTALNITQFGGWRTYLARK